MRSSKASCELEEEQPEQKKKDTVSNIYNIINTELRKEQNFDGVDEQQRAEKWVPMVVIEKAVLNAGYKKTALDETILMYTAIDVLEQTEGKDKLRFYAQQTQEYPRLLRETPLPQL